MSLARSAGLRSGPGLGRMMSTAASLDVAIVGCGFSGAYIAHRLSQARPELRLGIVERADRVGGRLMSSTAIDAGAPSPQYVEELGGMRIFPHAHRRMAALCDELDFVLDPRPLSGPATFFFDAETQARTPSGELPADAFDVLLARHDARHPGDAALDVYEQALHQMDVNGVWKEFGDASLDQRAWHAQLGYDDVGPISAACWREANRCLASAGPTHHQLAQGWQSVVSRMAGDTPVQFGKELVSVETSGPAGPATLGFGDGSALTADAVFLTAPLCHWNEISGLKAGLAARANAAVLNAKCTKCFLTWAEPWWERDFGLTTGRSITTTRARLVFYWDSDTLLVYTAGDAPPTQALAALEEEGGIEAVVEALLDDLSISHYGERGRVPAPEHAVFRAWDHAASWWLPGVDVPKLRGELLRPCGDGAPVFYANSNASDWQCWMEGAVQMADLALDAHADACPTTK